MSRFEPITIRDIEPADLEVFCVHQLDPEGRRLAAFVGKDPTDKVAFDAHWRKVLSLPGVTNRTILADGVVAGHVACFPDGETMEVTYWIGREFWGEGVATRALALLLQLVTVRPIHARAATDNLGSLRVLEKCGFKITGTDKGFAHGRGEETEEYLLRLDLEAPNA